MSYVPQVSRDGVTLRASTLQIVEGTYDTVPTIAAWRMQNWNQLILLCDMTLHTATSVEIKVQVASPTGDAVPASGDWHDLAYSGAPTVASAIALFPMATAVYQMTATGKLAIPVPCCYKFVRVLAKTTGAVGNTTLAVYATQGMA